MISDAVFVLHMEMPLLRKYGLWRPRQVCDLAKGLVDMFGHCILCLIQIIPVYYFTVGTLKALGVTVIEIVNNMNTGGSIDRGHNGYEQVNQYWLEWGQLY